MMDLTILKNNKLNINKKHELEIMHAQIFINKDEMESFVFCSSTLTFMNKIEQIWSLFY